MSDTRGGTSSVQRSRLPLLKETFLPEAYFQTPPSSRGSWRKPGLVIVCSRGLTQQILIFSQFWELKVQDLQGAVSVVSGEVSPPGLQIAAVSLCPHGAIPLYAWKESVMISHSLLVRTPVLWDRVSPLRPPLTLITSLRAPCPNTVTWGVRTPTYELGRRGHNLVLNRLLKETCAQS